MTNTAHNDEIDLKDILRIIWKRKFWIAGFVIFVCAVTVFTVLKMDNIYESKAVLRPVQNSTNQMSSALSNLGGLANLAGINIGSGGNVSPYNSMNAIVNDADFIYSFVTENKFESKIVDDYSEFSLTEKYKENQKFFVVKAFKDNFGFIEDSKTGLMTMYFQNKDREFSKKVVDMLLKETSLKYQTIEMENIDERINKYKNEIDKTSDIALKNKLAEVVAGLIQNKVVSQAQEYYGFDIIVKSGVPDSLDKIKPKRGIICIVAFFLSVCVGSFAVLAIESLKDINIG
ncbi:Wzz/FepE/Etk N-terminal domain-containing protein [Seleniivibrio woodruffii]|uniref:Wzz/FepE/Etk N-terminal domain-containing protein n=1 Tax=Seleniivibrio woodruffii TaxID=1078050 RepID=UPI00240A88F9|nr:Wzz/FepE/Etk N-terminal domain-containing protein [Seleniivibrio woodruffii]